MHLTADELRRCRVCGYDAGFPVWGADADTPSYVKCACCGVIFGHDDAHPVGILQHRSYWLDIYRRQLRLYPASERPRRMERHATQLTQIPTPFTDAAINAALADLSQQEMWIPLSSRALAEIRNQIDNAGPMGTTLLARFDRAQGRAWTLVPYTRITQPTDLDTEFFTDRQKPMGVDRVPTHLGFRYIYDVLQAFLEEAHDRICVFFGDLMYFAEYERDGDLHGRVCSHDWTLHYLDRTAATADAMYELFCKVHTYYMLIALVAGVTPEQRRTLDEEHRIDLDMVADGLQLLVVAHDDDELLIWQPDAESGRPCFSTDDAAWHPPVTMMDNESEC